MSMIIVWRSFSPPTTYRACCVVPCDLSVLESSTELAYSFSSTGSGSYVYYSTRSFARRLYFLASSMPCKGRFPLGVFLLAVEKILRFFFNLIGQLIFTDFSARGLKRKLNIVQLFFLSASFFSFVFSSASKNTPNGNRP